MFKEKIKKLATKLIKSWCFWSDEESEGSQEKDEEVHLRNHVALNSKMINNHHEHVATSHRYVLTVQYNATCLTSSTITGENYLHNSDSKIDSDKDEPSFENIQQMYNKIFQNWFVICKINKSLEEQMTGLTKEHELMKVEILQLTNLVAKKDRKIQETEQELFHTQRIMKLDFGKKKFDKVLSISKPCSDHHGLGYTDESSFSKTTFVKETKPVQSIFDKSNKPIFQKLKPKRFIPICHFYNLPRHIRPRYFRFKKALRNGMHFGSPASAMLQQKSKLAFVADISLKACTNDFWYFDSRCSRHMTSHKEKLKGYQSVNEGHVTFGDGQKGRILAKGVLNIKGLPKLKKVLHVEGLKANLISISQLCDQNLFNNVATNKTQLGIEKNDNTIAIQKEPSIRVQKNHPTDQIIGSLTKDR
ncbi:hypothetical protein Pfo_011695 [Paulownia fortunei]|nr:hypothetical protein Pfo_011695 [Paulownia fortunei]